MERYDVQSESVQSVICVANVAPSANTCVQHLPYLLGQGWVCISHIKSSHDTFIHDSQLVILAVVVICMHHGQVMISTLQLASHEQVRIIVSTAGC